MDRDGIAHVWNPSKSVHVPETLDAEELWRLGEDPDAEDEFFGFVSAIDVDAGGRRRLQTQTGGILTLDAPLASDYAAGASVDVIARTPPPTQQPTASPSSWPSASPSKPGEEPASDVQTIVTTDGPTAMMDLASPP